MNDSAPVGDAAEAVRLLALFVRDYAPGTCRRCDVIYWDAVRWDLACRGLVPQPAA